jgi:hypothetical protein
LRVAACPGVGAGAGQSRRYDCPWHPDHRVVRQRRSRDGGRDACGRGAKRFTYFCGFAATSGGATAAAAVNLTITNLITGTATYIYGAVAGAGVPSPSLVVLFNPCLPANAANTSIVVSMPSLGTGNINAIVSISKSAHYFPTL